MANVYKLNRWVMVKTNCGLVKGLRQFSSEYNTTSHNCCRDSLVVEVWLYKTDNPEVALALQPESLQILVQKIVQSTIVRLLPQINIFKMFKKCLNSGLATDLL